MHKWLCRQLDCLNLLVNVSWWKWTLWCITDPPISFTRLFGHLMCKWDWPGHPFWLECPFLKLLTSMFMNFVNHHCWLLHNNQSIIGCCPYIFDRETMPTSPTFYFQSYPDQSISFLPPQEANTNKSHCVHIKWIIKNNA